MVDTFEPLQLTVNVKETIDEAYPFSWLKAPQDFKPAVQIS